MSSFRPSFLLEARAVAGDVDHTNPPPTNDAAALPYAGTVPGEIGLPTNSNPFVFAAQSVTTRAGADHLPGDSPNEIEAPKQVGVLEILSYDKQVKEEEAARKKAELSVPMTSVAPPVFETASLLKCPQAAEQALTSASFSNTESFQSISSSDATMVFLLDDKVAAQLVEQMAPSSENESAPLATEYQQKIRDLEEENAELKVENAELKAAMQKQINEALRKLKISQDVVNHLRRQYQLLLDLTLGNTGVDEAGQPANESTSVAVPYTEKDVPLTASKRVTMNTSKEDDTTVHNAPAKSKPTSASTPKKVLFTKGAKYASAGETPNKTVTQSNAAPSTSKGFAEGDKVKIKKKGPYHGETGVVWDADGKRYKVELPDGRIVPPGLDKYFYSMSLKKL